MKSVGLRVHKEVYLMVDEGDKDYLLASLTEMKTKEPYLAEFLEEILIRRYFKKFYSNSYNFATILNKLGMTEKEYNDALYELVKREFLIKEKKRVYKLNELAYTLTQDEVNKLNDVDIVKL